MNISYGPPGARGVTQLMAVGADDIEHTATDRAVKVGSLIGLAVLGYGLVAKHKCAKTLGLGAVVALLGVRMASSGHRTVELTRPAT